MDAAKVISCNNEEYQVEAFNLNNFGSNNSKNNFNDLNSEATDSILNKLDSLSAEIQTLKASNTQAVSNKLDTQIVEALTSLNNHAKQLDKMSEAFENKLIAYSLKIASKIIEQEVREDSNTIALNIARKIIGELKDATEIAVHVSPTDYDYLVSNLDLSDIVKLVNDTNIQPSGIVISSDIGNFDLTIESKLETLSQSIKTLY